MFGKLVLSSRVYKNSHVNTTVSLVHAEIPNGPMINLALQTQVGAAACEGGTEDQPHHEE